MDTLLLERATLKGKNLLPTGNEFFPSRVAHFEKDSVNSEECSFLLELCPFEATTSNLEFCLFQVYPFTCNYCFYASLS